MTIRGVDFGPVWGASGVQGFFGEGYWFHKLAELVGLSWDGVTFVSKTTTLAPRKGNMPLAADGITPRHWFPACVRVKWWQGVTLNAVSLSGPGAAALLADGRWQSRSEPFMISFMPEKDSKAERLDEVRAFRDQVGARADSFRSPFGFQLNLSCPNTVHGQQELADEADEMLTMLGELKRPITAKVAADMPPAIGARIANHKDCDALCASNAIKFGQLKDKIDWRRYFASETLSPLAAFGGGALSGAPLLPITEAWVRAVRMLGVTKHINAGGGILHPQDVRRLFAAGANSVSLGTIAILRPWRVPACIRAAQDCAQQQTTS